MAVRASDMLESVACNFCQSEEAEPLFRSADKQYRNVPEGIQCGVVRCKKCGLVYLSPRVRREFIGMFYPAGEYYTQQEAPSDSFKIRLKDDLFGLIARRFLGYPAGQEPCRSGWNGHLLSCLAVLAAVFYPFSFRRIWPHIPGGRLLDFGFGAGGYLLRMRDLGWECWGVEMDRAAVSRMNGLGVKSFGDLWDPSLPRHYFDWITAYHSIEHTFDPQAYLGRLHELLKPGGKIYIGLPNFDSFAGRVFRGCWYNLSTPVHPYIFTARAAMKYLQHAGFKNIQLFYRSLPEDFLASVQHFLNSFMELLTGHKFRDMPLRNSRILRMACTPFVRLLDFFRCGDRIELIAGKEEAKG